MNKESTEPVDDATDLQGKIASLEGENKLKRISQLAQARNAAVRALSRQGAVSPPCCAS